MDARIRIVGVGSPFGDDELGWLAARFLQRSPALAPLLRGTVSIVICDRPGAALIDTWRGAESVVLIDAVCSAAAPGTLHRLSAAEIGSGSGLLSTHGFGVAEALVLARALGCLPPCVVLHGVERGADTGHAGLSAAVAAALPALVRALEAEIARLVDGAATPTDGYARG